MDDLIRLKGEVPFEGANAAALEVDPANSLAGHDPISIVRFTVKPALLELGRLKDNKTSLVRRLQELAVCVVALHHERIVLERLAGLHNHRSERWQIDLRLSQRCVESAEGASEYLRCHGTRSGPSSRSQSVTTNPEPECEIGQVPDTGRATSAPSAASSDATAYSRRTSFCEWARTATFATTGSGRSQTTVLFVSCNRTGSVLVIPNCPATSVAAWMAEIILRGSRRPVGHRQVGGRLDQSI